MNRKHLGMRRPVRRFNDACNEMMEYISAFSFLPPRGELAKEQAIQEWKEVINDVVIQLNNIKNTQIDLLLRNDEDNE